MKITRLQLRNYRTLEHLDLEFPSTYTAICGPNDAGKTNVVRAIRGLMKTEQSHFIPFYDEPEFSLKDDFTKWKDTDPADRKIELVLDVSVHRERDAGLYHFVITQLSLGAVGETLEFSISVTNSSERGEEHVSVRVAGNTHEGLQAQEVLKRIQRSKSILFHNSAQAAPPSRFSGGLGMLQEISAEHEDLLEKMKRTVNRGLGKIAKDRQKDLESLLGRLERKYKVGLSLSAFDFKYMPYNITLGEAKFEVPLDDWGSGTKNRTLIFVLLFTARQISEAEESADKITPIIVIEEPESFLHPAAQAEFGRVIHDLAEEFDVQVIVTTHSPYMLSVDKPEANILLNRRRHYTQLRETQRVDTSGDRWMEPFSQALGLDSDEFKPWKELFLAPAEAIFLVEGETDKAYFEMLRDPAHGAKRLNFTGEILSYDGTGALKNNVLLRLIKNRFKKMFVSYDLDAEKHTEKNLKMLGLEKGKTYCAIGVNTAGKRCIEGLLPPSVTAAVFNANPEVVQAATSGASDEQRSASHKLKQLYLAEFKKVAQPGDAFFKGFYGIVKLVNRALA